MLPEGPEKRAASLQAAEASASAVRGEAGLSIEEAEKQRARVCFEPRSLRISTYFNPLSEEVDWKWTTSKLCSAARKTLLEP